MGKEKDRKVFLKIARIVFKAIEREGNELQQGYASNAVVQVDLLATTYK